MTHPGGRPQANINWEKVKSLLEAGCSGREIAGNIGIAANTLYARCVQDNGIEFSEFSQQYNAKGESRLLAHQYAKALGITNEGDNTLLIWLGKVRLKQREHNPNDTKEAPNQPKIDDKHTIMLLSDENAKLKEIVNEYKSETKPEFCRGDTQI